MYRFIPIHIDINKLDTNNKQEGYFLCLFYYLLLIYPSL